MLKNSKQISLNKVCDWQFEQQNNNSYYAKKKKKKKDMAYR